MPMPARRHLLVTAVLIVAACGAALAAEPPPSAPVYGNSLGVDPAQRARPPMLSAPRLAIAGDPVLGAATAPVTIVEFIDYECPYCQRFAAETWPKLKAAYVDTGKVRFVARDFPLPRHHRARAAAVAAACARAQDRFWEMHDALLTDGGGLTASDFERLATRLGLDADRFAACSGDAGQGERLDQQVAGARALGVTGTPSFLVGASRGDVVQGQLLVGDETFADFEKVLTRYLGP
jgi:protein-disulfide isomerase